MKKLFLAAFAGSLINIASAQKPAVVASDKTGWHKIGETTVNFQNDRDEVDVLMANRFASLKFKVDDAPIDISSIDVIFEEGDSQTISTLLSTKNAGEETREVDLK